MSDVEVDEAQEAINAATRGERLAMYTKGKTLETISDNKKVKDRWEWRDVPLYVEPEEGPKA